MFILKSTHDAAIKREREFSEALLSELKSQIEDLRKLVFVKAPTSIEALPVRTVNAVLDGAEVMPQASPEREEELREMNRIFSGEYTNEEEIYN